MGMITQVAVLLKVGRNVLTSTTRQLCVPRGKRYIKYTSVMGERY